MKDNLGKSFAFTMKWEGGSSLSMNPKDPGNWTGNKVGKGVLKGTKYGVAAGSHPELNISGLSEDAAAQIFKREYWDNVGGDNLQSGLDHCVSDDAYSAGPGNAARLYSAVLRGAASASAHDRIIAFSTERLSFLRSLRTWNTFSRGWPARVAGVEAESLSMAYGVTSQTIAKHADEAQKKSSNATKGVGGAGAAVGASAVSGIPWQAVAIVVAIAVAAVVVLMWRARAHSARAEALTNLAKAMP